VKKAWFIVLAFLLGFSSVFGYLYLRKQVTKPAYVSSVVPSHAPEPTFALEPPSQAVNGTLSVATGHALKFSRGDTEYKEASTGAQVLIGESVATNTESSASVVVPNIVVTDLSENAEVVYANMFLKNFVLQQKNGDVRYAVTMPISVRVLHTLVQLNPGEYTISVSDSDVSVTVKTGSAKLGLVELDNTTRVWEVGEGERADIFDTTRRVRLVHTR
jgi:hypothetical protein